MSPDPASTVVVVGLGRMGAPIAGHLLAAGYGVVGLDPRPDAGADLVDAGLDVRRGWEGLRGRFDADGPTGCLLTVDGAAVADVLLDEGVPRRWRLPWPTLAVVCSTVAPAAMDELDRAAADAGARLVDAPLCRGDHAARTGDLLALLGCAEADRAAATALLRAFCTDVVDVGAVGAGQAVKLANNVLLWSHIAATVEALRLGEGLGVRRSVLRDALRRSSAASWVLDTWDRPRELPWADEDLAMAEEVSERIGLRLPVAGAVRDAVRGIREAGLLHAGGLQDRGWSLPG